MTTNNNGKQPRDAQAAAGVGAEAVRPDPADKRFINIEELKARKDRQGGSLSGARSSDRQIAQGYDMARGIIDIGQFTHPVRCTVPNFEHLVVHYSVANPSRKRREQPVFQAPPEVSALTRKAAQVRAQADALPGEDPEKVKLLQEAASLWTRSSELLNEYGGEVNKQLCRWLSLYVKGIDGWNFELDGEEIPCPQAAAPDTFLPLVENAALRPFYFWLRDDGYQLALNEALTGATPNI